MQLSLPRDVFEGLLRDVFENRHRLECRSLVHRAQAQPPHESSMDGRRTQPPSLFFVEKRIRLNLSRSTTQAVQRARRGAPTEQAESFSEVVANALASSGITDESLDALAPEPLDADRPKAI